VRRFDTICDVSPFVIRGHMFAKIASHAAARRLGVPAATITEGNVAK
jgi:hypothetical protein